MCAFSLEVTIGTSIDEHTSNNYREREDSVAQSTPGTSVACYIAPSICIHSLNDVGLGRRVGGPF